MGRYYTGDIEGKFWFGLQPSDAADRFGVEGYQPEELQYEFLEEHKEDVLKEIEAIKKSLGKHRETLDKHLIDNQGYCFDDLPEVLGVKKSEVEQILHDYADLELGIAISEELSNSNRCFFSVEL